MSGLDEFDRAREKFRRDMAQIDREEGRLHGALLAAGAVLAVLVIVALAVAPAPADLEARDKQELGCRKDGGTWEYFHSQGWHCIGPKK